MATIAAAKLDEHGGGKLRRVGSARIQPRRPRSSKRGREHRREPGAREPSRRTRLQLDLRARKRPVGDVGDVQIDRRIPAGHGVERRPAAGARSARAVARRRVADAFPAALIRSRAPRSRSAGSASPREGSPRRSTLPGGAVISRWKLAASSAPGVGKRMRVGLIPEARASSGAGFPPCEAVAGAAVREGRRDRLPRISGARAVGVAPIARRAVQQRQRLVVRPLDDAARTRRRRLGREQDEVAGESLEYGDQLGRDRVRLLLLAQLRARDTPPMKLRLVAGDDVVEQLADLRALRGRRVPDRRRRPRVHDGERERLVLAQPQEGHGPAVVVPEVEVDHVLPAHQRERKDPYSLLVAIDAQRHRGARNGVVDAHAPADGAIVDEVDASPPGGRPTARCRRTRAAGAGRTFGSRRARPSRRRSAARRARAPSAASLGGCGCHGDPSMYVVARPRDRAGVSPSRSRTVNAGEPSPQGAVDLADPILSSRGQIGQVPLSPASGP